MAGRRAAWAAVGCLLLAWTLAVATGESPPPELPSTELQQTASTAAELLDALNRTQGSDKSLTIHLLDDIYISPQDVRAWWPWLPFDGGNRTMVLRGAGGAVVLDFGRAVNLIHHPAGHSSVFRSLILQGLAPAAAGLAAGLTTQMVAAPLWPTTTGEPGHLMMFCDCQIRSIAKSCTAHSTSFSMHALRRMAGGTETITQQGDLTILVEQQLNFTYPVRNLTTGDPVGNMHFSLQGVMLACSAATTNNSQAFMSALATNQTAPTGVAGSADEFMLLLATPHVTRILLGVHINLRIANWSLWGPQLPIELRDRNVDVLSNDETLKTLDLAEQPQLLYLSADSGLTLSNVHLQGIAPASAVLTNRTTAIPGSPLWPTVDGESGHRVSIEHSVVHAIVSPCSARSNNITVQLIQQMVGPEGARVLGESDYVVLPPWRRKEPIVDVLTKHEVGFGFYCMSNTIVDCEEDSAVSLAAELQLQRGTLAGPAHSGMPAGGSSSSSGGSQRWLLPVLASAAAAFGTALAVTGFALWHRRRRARACRAAAAAAAAAAGSQRGEGKEEVMSPRTKSLHRMESGDRQLGAALSPALSSGGLGAANSHGARSASRAGSGQLERALSAEGWHADPLFRCRFGVIEGLEVGELLGRGAFGRVYKSRWNGAWTAVKVVEHSVSATSAACCCHGGCEACGSNVLAREPLLCMGVSHPNCVTTYKLSMIRLLRGADLVHSEESIRSIEAGLAGGPTAGAASDRASEAIDGSSASIPAADPEPPRRVHSLLSGAEGEEVADPYGPLAPGLYETWMVLEYCDRGSLADALAERRLVGKDGRPHMVAVLLCLLDVASGMSYLHSLGIVHGDLKPANVLLKGVRNSARGFQCKLADFGLSRMLDGRATHVQTGSLGTPTHAAPELLREGRLASPADVYAFGVLAWELVAGEEAWLGHHPMQIILQVTQQGARPPPLPHCPPRLAALMQACWAEDPQRRPRFSDLLPQLQELLQAVRWQAKQAQQVIAEASSQPAADGSQSSAPSRCASIDTQASAASEGSTAPLLRAGSLPPLARAGSSPQPLCPECSAQQL